MIECNKIAWHHYHGALLPTVLPHQEVILSRRDIKNLLKQSNAYFLRWTNEWDCKKSKFWYVVKDTFSDMDQLSANTRSKIRRAGKRCFMKKVDKETIAKNGYEVYKNAFDRYRTYLKPMNRKNFYENIMEKKDYDFFAIYKKDTNIMIAYSTNKISGKVCNYTTIKFHPKYLKLYPSYLLFFKMSEYYLKENNFHYIHDGARSISHDTRIHEFLLQTFKFKKVFVKLNLAYRWDIKIIVSIIYPFKKIIDKFPSNTLTDKLKVLLLQESIARKMKV